MIKNSILHEKKSQGNREGNRLQLKGANAIGPAQQTEKTELRKKSWKKEWGGPREDHPGMRKRMEPLGDLVTLGLY